MNLDEARAELVRSRAFIRGAETQLTKALDALDVAMKGPWAEPEEPELDPDPAPEPEPEPDPDPDLPQIMRHDFDALPGPAGWVSGTVKGGGLTVAEGIGRMTYPRGWTGGYPPGYVQFERMPKDIRRIRLHVRTRLSPEFQGHHSASKWGFIWTGGRSDRPYGYPKVVLQLVGGGQDPIHPAIWLQDVPMPDTQAAKNLTQNVALGVIERGRWFDWVVEVVQNTGDAPDAEIRWWVDGQLLGEYTTGIRLTRGDEQKHFPIVSWRPIWGGLGGQTIAEQWMECSSIDIRGA